jgi:hypothetical protein
MSHSVASFCTLYSSLFLSSFFISFFRSLYHSSFLPLLLFFFNSAFSSNLTFLNFHIPFYVYIGPCLLSILFPIRSPLLSFSVLTSLSLLQNVHNDLPLHKPRWVREASSAWEANSPVSNYHTLWSAGSRSSDDSVATSKWHESLLLWLPNSSFSYVNTLTSLHQWPLFEFVTT